MINFNMDDVLYVRIARKTLQGKIQYILFAYTLNMILLAILGLIPNFGVFLSSAAAMIFSYGLAMYSLALVRNKRSAKLSLLMRGIWDFRRLILTNVYTFVITGALILSLGIVFKGICFASNLLFGSLSYIMLLPLAFGFLAFINKFFLFVFFVLIDNKSHTPWNALKESIALSKEYKEPLFKFAFIELLAGGMVSGFVFLSSSYPILSIIISGIGTLVVTLYFEVAKAHLYTDITAKRFIKNNTLNTYTKAFKN